MEARNRLMDDLSRVAGGALGALGGLRGEVEVLVRQRLERLVSTMDLVTREEFEAVRAMAQEARLQQEVLEKKVAELESQLAKPAKGGSPSRARRAPQVRAKVTSSSAAKSAKAADAAAEPLTDDEPPVESVEGGADSTPEKGSGSE